MLEGKLDVMSNVIHGGADIILHHLGCAEYFVVGGVSRLHVDHHHHANT